MNRVSTTLIALLVSIGWPLGALAVGFDFQLLEFQVIGENAFFDDFEDGLRDSPPTSQLLALRGVVSESGGALQFNDADGALQVGQILDDAVLFAPSFTDGGGGAVVTAVWEPAAASADYQWFGMSVASLSSQGASFFFGIGTEPPPGAPVGPCGPGLQASFGYSGSFPSGCDVIDPVDVTGNSVLKLILDDERNEVRGLYSIDGGLTFTAFSGFDVPGPRGTLFEFFPDARVRVLAQGAVPEPSSPMLLLGAALAAASRGARRQAR